MVSWSCDLLTACTACTAASVSFTLGAIFQEVVMFSYVLIPTYTALICPFFVLQLGEAAVAELRDNIRLKYYYEI